MVQRILPHVVFFNDAVLQYKPVCFWGMHFSNPIEKSEKVTHGGRCNNASNQDK